ncbi:MAG: TolC family protein [Hyphomicrobiales bacterium]
MVGAMFIPGCATNKMAGPTVEPAEFSANAAPGRDNPGRFGQVATLGSQMIAPKRSAGIAGETVSGAGVSGSNGAGYAGLIPNFTAGPGHDNLRSAIQSALAYSATVRKAVSNLHMARLDISIARSGYFPKVRSSAGSNSDSSMTYRLSVTQPIYDWGQTGAAVDKAKANLVAATAQLDTQREITALVAAQAYIEVKRNEALFEAAQDNFAEYKKITELASDRYGGGVGDSADVQFAKVRQGEARSSLEDAASNLRNARAVYDSRMGHKPGKLAQAPDLVTRLDMVGDFKRAVAKAPAVRYALAKQKAFMYDTEMQEASLLPTLGANATIKGNDDNSFLKSYGLTLQAPVFSGFSNFEKAKSARLAANSAGWEAEEERRKAVRQVNEFIETAPLLRSRVTILDKESNKAHHLQGLYHDQFLVGHRSLTDLLNMQLDIFRIAKARIAAHFNMLKTQYNALSAIGRLLSGLGIKIEGGGDE